MAFPFLLLAAVVVGFIGLMLLMPKPKVENARPQGLSDLNFPTASEGSPLPLILGTVRHRGPNTIGGPVDFRTVAIKKKVKTGLFSSKKVTVGYKYYVGLDLGLGLGPGVTLGRIWFDKDEVWAGTAGPGETAIAIDKPSLWGGEEKGGGFVGTLRFYGGNLTQPVNAYMAGEVSNGMPAYVGQTHIVLEGCYIGTQAQLRAMSFELSRFTNAIGLSAGHEKIGQDMNPAEMLYQIMTLDWGGLDVDPNDINLPSFVAAGETLFNEGNGMSLLISNPNAGKDAIEEVLRQIDGVMYQDPVTGKIILSLIREDYALEDLMVLDKTNVSSVRSFSRTSWDDTVNQVRVTYTNRSNKYEKGSAIVQDLANINSQGRIRSTNFSFPGVTEGELANKLASRELAQTSVPLFRATLEVNRSAANLRPGQAFIWSWDEYRIEQVVMRVQRFNLGDLIDGRIVIDCVQDKYAVDATIFAPPEDTSHEVTDRSAKPLVQRLLSEVPYWIMQQQEFIPLPPSAADRTFVMGLARGANEYQQGYTVTVEQGAASAVIVDHLAFPDSAILNAPFDRLAGFTTGATSITIISPTNDGDWLANGSVSAGETLLLIGTEIIGFETRVDNGDGTWTLNNVRRGLLDTMAVDHAAGEVLYHLTADPIGESEWLASTAMTGKFQAYTDKDETPYASADTTALAPSRRYERPLSPDWLTVAGSRAPGLANVGPHAVAWRPRSRLTGTVRLENDAADAEEAGVTYTLRVYIDGVLDASRTQTGLATPTANVTLINGNHAYRIEVVSVRGGLESFTPGWIEFNGNVASAPANYRYFFLEVQSTGNGYIGVSTLKLIDGAAVDQALQANGGVATPVGYSENLPTYPVTKVNDGDDVSFTTSAGSVAGVGKGIQIDLGAQKTIVKMGYRSRSDGFGAAESIRTGTVYGKVNAGDPWTPIYNVNIPGGLASNTYVEWNF